jgi:NADH-quinone oxidoreductase subunit H
LAISGLGVYGTILAGWASNSKYAFLGALRAAAQMISYEVSLSLTILPVILATGSLNLTDIVYSQMLYGFNFFFFAPSAVIFFVSALAETNRAPFDLAEAEAEIVAGYNLEYSAIIFALFFLGEYGNMTLLSALWVIFFLRWLVFSYFRNFFTRRIFIWF